MNVAVNLRINSVDLMKVALELIQNKMTHDSMVRTDKSSDLRDNFWVRGKKIPQKRGGCAMNIRHYSTRTWIKYLEAVGSIT